MKCVLFVFSDGMEPRGSKANEGLKANGVLGDLRRKSHLIGLTSLTLGTPKPRPKLTKFLSVDALATAKIDPVTHGVSLVRVSVLIATHKCVFVPSHKPTIRPIIPWVILLVNKPNGRTDTGRQIAQFIIRSSKDRLLKIVTFENDILRI